MASKKFVMPCARGRGMAALTAAAALTLAACSAGTPLGSQMVLTTAPVESPAARATPASPSPRPSPTPVPGGRIAFGTFAPNLGDFLIYTARPDGSDEKLLLPDAHECPVWSRDGTEIAVTAGVGGGFATIVHPDGTNPRALKLADPNMTLGCGAWSPDGQQLALEGWDQTKVGAEGIYLVRTSDGGGLKRLTSPLGGIHDSPVSFSADGKEIAFLHNNIPEDPNAPCAGPGELWVIDADGGHPRRVGDQVVGQGAGFSPDGRRLAAVAGTTVLLFDAGNLTAPPKLVELPAGYAGCGVRWSPDGSRLVLALFEPGRSPNVYTMEVDGTDLWQVTHTTQESAFGAWGLPPG
jgi:Tol biopolymer transport system component